MNSPHVILALFIASKALERMAGKPWSEDEDQRLLAGFDAGTPVAALALPTSAAAVPSPRGWSGSVAFNCLRRHPVARMPESNGALTPKRSGGAVPACV